MNSKFLAQALKGENSGWLYLVGIVAVFVGYFLGQMPFAIVSYYTAIVRGGLGQVDYADSLATMDMDALMLGKNLGLALLLLMFVIAFGLLWLCVSRLHLRALKTLVTGLEQINWSKIRFGFGLWIALGFMAEFMTYCIQPENYVYTFQWQSMISLLLICLTILPIQTTFEEVFFRGYILQGLASWFHRSFQGTLLNTRFALVIITAILFSLVHSSNPEIHEYGFWIMMANYVSAGIFLGILTVMDDSLELAIGAHWATNFYAATIVGYNGAAIQTDSIYKMKQIDPYIMLLVLIISGTIFAFVCMKKYTWPSFTHLFSQIQLQTINNEEIIAEHPIG